LSDSTNKTNKEQYKVVIEVLAAIDKPASSLATDLKTAETISKDLEKAFPDDATLSSLVAGVFAGILSDTTDDLEALQEAAGALPPGKAQTEAFAEAAKAQTALNTADAAPDQKTLSTALSSALDSIKDGDKDLTIKSSGGTQYFKANIGGKSFTAKTLSVAYAMNSDDLAFSGTTSVPHSGSDYDFQSINIAFVNFSGVGTYYGDDTPDTDFQFYYLHDTATSNEEWDTYVGGGSGSFTVTYYNSAVGAASGNFDILVVNDNDQAESMRITGTFSLMGDDLKGY
jgi:hypothetical protein